MIKDINIKDSSSMVQTRTIIHVDHEHFSVDVEYMLICYKHEGKWLIDAMDFGRFLNLTIDGIRVSDDECNNYFDIMNKLGVTYEKEVLDYVENFIHETSLIQFVGDLKI